MSSNPPLFWRQTRLARVGFGSLPVVVGVVVAADSYYTIGDSLAGSLLAGAAVASVFVAMWATLALRPRLGIIGDTVHVRNPIFRHEFPLKDIVDVFPGYCGLEIGSTDGRTVTAFAVSKTNISWMLGRETRGDKVARVLLARAAEARAERLRPE